MVDPPLRPGARAEEGIGTGRQKVVVEERNELDRLSPEQRATWMEAVGFYRRHLARLSHFSTEMMEAKAELLIRSQNPEAPLPDGTPGLAGQLEAAMGVYRDSWWPEHDSLNRAWIDGLVAMARRFEPEYVSAMERSCGGRWEEVLRVDASAYANWGGGYTTVEPAHTVVWTKDARNAGAYGMELVYHEASHQRALARPNRRGLEAAFARAGAEVPGNLWHVVIFYTSGWVTRNVAAQEGWPEHAPYAVAEGLTGFRGWRGLWPVLEEHWAPLLEGRRSREGALAAVADAMTRPSLEPFPGASGSSP